MKPPSITLGDYVVAPHGRPDPEGCYAWKLRGPGATGNVTRSFQPDARPHIEDKARTWLEGQGLIDRKLPEAKAIRPVVGGLRKPEPPLPPRAPMPEPAPARPLPPAAVVEDVPAPPPVASALIARSIHDEVLAELARTRAALAAAEGKLVEAEVAAAALDMVAEALGLDPTTATAEAIVGRARTLSEDPVGAVAIRARIGWYTEEIGRLNVLADRADELAALDAEAEALAAEASRIAARQAEVAEKRAALVAA